MVNFEHISHLFPGIVNFEKVNFSLVVSIYNIKGNGNIAN